MHPMTVSDLELLAGVARQNRESFSALYDRFAGRIYGIIFTILKNQSDAEDVFQETLLQAWNQAPRFDATRSTPEGWLIMMARSRAVDRLRKKKLATVDMTEADRVTAGQAEATADFKEEASKACQALDRLEPDQREPIRLSFFSGLTHTQISERLKLPLGTVKTRIRNGMIRLRDEWNARTENS